MTTQCAANGCKQPATKTVCVHGIPVQICLYHWDKLESLTGDSDAILRSSLDSRIERIHSEFREMFVSEEIAKAQIIHWIHALQLPCQMGSRLSVDGEEIALRYKGRAGKESGVEEEMICALGWSSKEERWLVRTYHLAPYNQRSEYRNEPRVINRHMTLNEAIKDAISFAVAWHIQRQWWLETEDYQKEQ